MSNRIEERMAAIKEWIPAEDLRNYFSPHQLNKKFDVRAETRILPGSLINRWGSQGRAVPGRRRGSGLVYRPIDVIVRAWAKGYEILPPRKPKREQLMLSVQELEEKRAELTADLQQISKLHQLGDACSQLTGASMLTPEEICKGLIPTGGLSGVYFLIKDGEIKYVGQSLNVFSRTAHHNKSKDIDGFAYIPCDPKILDILESMYLHVLRPPWNGGRKWDDGVSAPIRLDALLKMASSQAAG